ncbi:hypothetical protein [Streptomyces sp. NPDC048496]|uniref:hypothetical protein n=1 Tax=Streptomyces sp. NPDC048496 TaxID=3365558 RepID=UPI003722EC49
MASSPAQPANRAPTSGALGGIRNCASFEPRGRFISSIGQSTTRPVIRWISTLCRSSRNAKYVVSAWDRANRVPLGDPRSTRPKYASASAGSISHSGRPNHVRICSRLPTSPRMVPSASPAEARANTNPASTSVSNASNSSVEAGGRNSRRSRTAASANPSPLSFTQKVEPS